MRDSSTLAPKSAPLAKALALLLFCLVLGLGTQALAAGFIVEEIGAGKEYKPDSLTYLADAKSWKLSFADGTEAAFAAEAVSVNTPAGIVWFDDKGVLNVNAGDGEPIVQIRQDKEGTWHFDIEPDQYSALAMVKPENGKPFAVKASMFYVLEGDNWVFLADGGTEKPGTYNAMDVEVTTALGTLLVFEGNLVIVWGDDDWRKDELPMNISVMGNEWQFFQGLIGE